MRDRIDEFGPTTVVAITFATASELPPHREHLGLDFPMLADPERALYRRFDLGRGKLHRIWSPGTLRLYAQLVRQGRRLERPTQDTRQLGGDFVLDPQGRLAAGFWPQSPDDRPTIDQLVDAVSATR